MYTVSIRTKLFCETKEKFEYINILIKCWIYSFKVIITWTSHERGVFSLFCINKKSISFYRINKVNIYIIFIFLHFWENYKVFIYTVSIRAKLFCETKEKLEYVNILVKCYIYSFNVIITMISHERYVFYFLIIRNRYPFIE